MPFVMFKSKFKNRVSVSKEFAFLTEVQWDISDLPFVRNKVIVGANWKMLNLMP